MEDPISKARAFVASRRLTNCSAPAAIDWGTLVKIARELRSEPTRRDRYGFARLARWQDIAEYLQREFAELAKMKTSTLASAVCSRYHNTYSNKKKCKKNRKLRRPRSSSPGAAAPFLDLSLAASPLSPAAGSSLDLSTTGLFQTFSSNDLPP